MALKTSMTSSLLPLNFKSVLCVLNYGPIMLIKEQITVKLLYFRSNPMQNNQIPILWVSPR